MHLGHQAVIDQMVEDHGDDCIILIGSVNESQSMRHFFSYAERKSLIREQYSSIRILGLPDFEDNDDWFSYIQDTLLLVWGDNPSVEYYSGCKEDSQVLSAYTENIVILNRFDGTHPKVSATEVRDALIYNRPLTGLVHEDLTWSLNKMFTEKWQAFKKK